MKIIKEIILNESELKEAVIYYINEKFGKKITADQIDFDCHDPHAEIRYFIKK